MNEHKDMVTFQGGPLTLIGELVQAGQAAPDFELLDSDMNTVKLGDFKDKVVIICSAPSLDTPVCDTEARKFNEKASELADDVAVVFVSMDLPFAQGRFCSTAGIKNVKTVSDHRQGAFGTDYGVLIKELRLLARAIFVLDKKGVTRYTQLVKEIADEPNYDEVLNAAKKLI